MNNTPLHTTMLLQALISLLQEEGITINTAAAIQIEKVLFHSDLEVYDTFSKLKFRIVPIISRNKEEQDHLYKAFDKLDSSVLKEKTWIQVNPLTSGELIEKDPAIVKPRKYYPVIFSALFVVVVLLALWINRDRLPVKTKITEPGFRADKDEIVVGDTVQFVSTITDSTERSQYSIDWQFADTLIKNQWQVFKVFRDTGEQLVSTYKINKNGQIVSSVKNKFVVLCELPPSVTIKKLGRARITAGAPARGEQYFASFSNATNDSNYYRYKWLIDDSIITGNRSVTATNKGNHNVRLVVYRDPSKTTCSSDSMVAEIRDEPAIAALITGDGKLKIVTQTEWKNIVLFWLTTLLISLVAALVLYRLLKLKKTTEQPAEEPIETSDEGPYSIDFKSHDFAINTESDLEKLADILRKRQLSESCRLNIRRTINNTVRSGGLPQLAYTALLKPSDYLVLIEKENADSHLVKLFEYFFEKLRKEQVNLEVYEYKKEPLFLDNEKLNHSRIPLDRLAALYPGRVLLIFGDSRQFVFALKGILKEWVGTKLNAWKTKIIVTPYPKNDWDKKEFLLMEAGFTVVPADLNAQVIIDKVLNGQIDSQSDSRYILPESYSARFLNFQEFNTLKEYISEEILLRWVCSLAVYPSVDWNLTIAIGEAIQADENRKGSNIELVNYSNLLKLGRISWLQEGIIPDTIKVQMLQYIDNQTENLARETLVGELNNLENKIVAGSLLKRQFDAHEKVNTFLVGAYNNIKPSKQDTAFIKDLMSKSQVDQAHEIYLKGGSDTLVKHPYKKEGAVSLTEYFNKIDIRKKLTSRLAAMLTFVSVFVLTFFLLKNYSTIGRQWYYLQPARQTFILDHPGLKFNKNDYKGSVAFNNFTNDFSLENDTIQINDITLADNSGMGSFTLKNTNGSVITQDSFTMNSNVYTVKLSTPSTVPVAVYFKSFSDTALANALVRNLPANYDVNLLQGSSFDTGINVQYFEDNQKKDAELVTSIINLTFSRQLTAEHHISHIKGDTGRVISIYVSSLDACTPVRAGALPKTLTEIWQGGSGNNFRLVNINLSSKVFYFSSGDKNNYTSFPVSEICLTNTGAYKITAKTPDGFQVYFIKNVTPRSFDLSLCGNIYKTKEQAGNINESICNTFYRMTFFYEKNPSLIYLPVSGSGLVNSERLKLKKIQDSIEYYQNSNYDVKYIQRDYIRANKYMQESILPNEYLSAIRQYRQSTRGDISLSVPTPNPFQRNYFSIKLETSIKEAPPENKPTTGSNLGTILLDGKYYPTPEGLKLIEDISNTAKQIKGAQIVLEGTYSGTAELSAIKNTLQTIRAKFLTSGLGTDQIKELLTAKLIQQNAPVQQSKVTVGINVTGNFQLRKKASAY